MEFLIDGEGRFVDSSDIAPLDAVWRAGFINLRQVDADSVVVRLQPGLVGGKTLAAALYHLADLAPEYIACVTGPGARCAQLFTDVRAAQVAIVRLTGATQNL